MGDFRKDIEDQGAEICKEGKAGSDPENPSEVSSVLKGYALVIQFCTQ